MMKRIFNKEKKRKREKTFLNTEKSKEKQRKAEDFVRSQLPVFPTFVINPLSLFPSFLKTYSYLFPSLIIKPSAFLCFSLCLKTLCM